MKERQKYQQWSLFTLFYTLLVILWGAWVRISHSGDGCGESWPLCQDQLIPKGSSLPMWIEFSHRASSGLFLLLIVWLVILTYRTYPVGHWLRRWSWLIAFFTFTEAMVGAVLVVLGLTGNNTSVARAYVMGVHMVNSMALVGVIVISYFGAVKEWRWKQLALPGPWKKWAKPLSMALIAGFLLINCMGAIAALAGTLFPSESLMEGIMKDFSRDSHFLVRLRVWHPFLATTVGLLLFITAIFVYFGAEEREETELKASSRNFLLLLCGGIAFGYATLFALSPTWMKLSHLLLAHLLWIFLVRAYWHFYLISR